MVPDRQQPLSPHLMPIIERLLMVCEVIVRVLNGRFANPR